MRLPVSVDGSFHVTRLGSAAVQTGFVSSSPNPFSPFHAGSAKYVLLFDTGPLTPVGATVFRVTKARSQPHMLAPSSATLQSHRGLQSKNGKDEGGEVVASNGLVTVHFDRYVLWSLVFSVDFARFNEIRDSC